jgi:hypothetical protein
MQRIDVFHSSFSRREKLGEAMRKLMIFLCAAAAVTFAATGAASAAPFSPAAVCKAAAKASVIAKAGCRVVRKCGYFGCSYEQVCT